MTVEEILEHERRGWMGEPVYYAHKVIEYVSNHGRREQLWTVIYEVPTPQVLVDLGAPETTKRWVLHDTGDGFSKWAGGICG